MTVKVELSESEIFLAIYQYVRENYPDLIPKRGSIYEKTRYRDMSATIECYYKKDIKR